MGKGEKKEQLGSMPQQGIGIVLDSGDLAELWIRKYHTQLSGASQVTQGAMSFPRHTVLDNDALSRQINFLEKNNRVKVDIRTARTFCPARSGNVVVYPDARESVETTLRGIDLQALDPALKLYADGNIPIHSVTLMPNTSPGKPKGIIIEAEQSKEKWWRSLQSLGWSFGRGVRIVSLGIDADQFIDQSEEILQRTLRIGQMMPQRSLKYVQYLHDQDGRMYMAMAGGMSSAESADVVKQLASVPQRKQADELIRKVNTECRRIRDQQVAALTDVVDIPEGELLVESNYIGLDFDKGMIFSGATDESSTGMVPFTVGTSGIILHVDQPDGAIPIGTKSFGRLRQNCAPIVPSGVVTHDLSLASNALFDLEQIQEYISAFSHPIELHTLALGYHADWGRQRK